MTFPRNKKEINVEKLSEVINDNETGKRFYETSDKVISINKETPERIPNFNDSHYIFKEYVGGENPYIKYKFDNIKADIPELVKQIKLFLPT